MSFFQSHRWLLLILLVALGLRLYVAAGRDIQTAFMVGGGGDEVWYMNNGWGLVSGQIRGVIRGQAFEIEALPSPPVYLLIVGIPQFLLPEHDAARFVLILQTIMGTTICFFAYGIAHRIANDNRAGLIAAAALAISPAFIITGTYLLTETTAIFFLSAGLWAYTEWVNKNLSTDYRGEFRHSLLLIAGILLGLATLTRAAFILFPALVALHLVWIYRRQWRRGILLALLLLLVYGATISTWTAYNFVRFNRFIVVSNQFMPAVWRGAVADDASTPQEMDAMLLPDCTENCSQPLADEIYSQQVTTTITADLAGYIQRRLNEMLNASSIPYGTQEMPGESLRELLRLWLTEDFSWQGFLRLVNGDYFWLKLAMYGFHYGGILFGLVGLWHLRRRPDLWMIPMSLIIYTHGIHLVLLALPRYLFPTQVCWWLLAAVGIKHLLYRRSNL